jgi:endonuclease III
METHQRKKRKVATTSPFPKYNKPTPENAYQALKELESVHGKIEKPKNKGSVSVLDSLVRTILSQNTTDVTSLRAFKQLKNRFPKYEDIETAHLKDIEAEIKCCGLAERRASVIQNIIRTLRGERNKLSLEYLHGYTDEEVKKELCRFKGVGPKTAACVLMFCLCRPEFPVDTHVWRISKKLKWVPKPAATRVQTYLHLNARIPDDIKYQLHCLLVEHGKYCKKCAKNNKPRKKPIIENCPLNTGCMKNRNKHKEMEKKKKIIKNEIVIEIKKEIKVESY